MWENKRDLRVWKLALFSKENWHLRNRYKDDDGTKKSGTCQPVKIGETLYAIIVSTICVTLTIQCAACHKICIFENWSVCNCIVFHLVFVAASSSTADFPKRVDIIPFFFCFLSLSLSSTFAVWHLCKYIYLMRCDSLRVDNFIRFVFFLHHTNLVIDVERNVSTALTLYCILVFVTRYSKRTHFVFRCFFFFTSYPFWKAILIFPWHIVEVLEESLTCNNNIFIVLFSLNLECSVHSKKFEILYTTLTAQSNLI